MIVICRNLSTLWNNHVLHWPLLQLSIRNNDHRHTSQFRRLFLGQLRLAVCKVPLNLWFRSLGRRWTAVQNLTPLALTPAEKSVTVQIHNTQTVTDISTPCLSTCVDNNIQYYIILYIIYIIISYCIVSYYIIYAKIWTIFGDYGRQKLARILFHWVVLSVKLMMQTLLRFRFIHHEGSTSTVK